MKALFTFLFGFLLSINLYSQLQYVFENSEDLLKWTKYEKEVDTIEYIIAGMKEMNFAYWKTYGELTIPILNECFSINNKNYPFVIDVSSNRYLLVFLLSKYRGPRYSNGKGREKTKDNDLEIKGNSTYCLSNIIDETDILFFPDNSVAAAEFPYINPQKVTMLPRILRDFTEFSDQLSIQVFLSPLQKISEKENEHIVIDCSKIRNHLLPLSDVFEPRELKRINVQSITGYPLFYSDQRKELVTSNIYGGGFYYSERAIKGASINVINIVSGEANSYYNERIVGMYALPKISKMLVMDETSLNVIDLQNIPNYFSTQIYYDSLKTLEKIIQSTNRYYDKDKLDALNNIKNKIQEIIIPQIQKENSDSAVDSIFRVKNSFSDPSDPKILIIQLFNKEPKSQELVFSDLNLNSLVQTIKLKTQLPENKKLFENLNSIRLSEKEGFISTQDELGYIQIYDLNLNLQILKEFTPNQLKRGEFSETDRGLLLSFGYDLPSEK